MFSGAERGILLKTFLQVHENAVENEKQAVFMRLSAV
jgi:hypothetical protein